MRKLIMASALFGACVAPTKIGSSTTVPVVVVAPPPPQPDPAFTEFVVKSNPGLPKPEAIRIARLVENVAQEFEVPADLFMAIVRHESHFKSGIKVCRNLMGRRTCDYGIAQVNSFWVDELELDAKKLRNDDEYNLRIAAGILRGVLDRHGREGRFAYSYYNTADPELRVVYQDKVERYRKVAASLRN
jgi:soluble lytic murein transglycosylase-like protein